MDTLPEELLERILGFNVLNAKSTNVLCVSSTFHRVALPLFHRTVKLRDAESCEKMLDLPESAHIRPHTLVISHSALYSPSLPSVLRQYGSHLEEVDVTMSMPVFDNKRDNVKDIEELCESLAELDSIKRFTLRKAPGSPFLLGAPWVRDFVTGLAVAITPGRWTSLESLYIAFKMSQLDAFTRLVSSFSALPRLHTFATDMPSVWNDLLLEYVQRTQDSKVILLLPGAPYDHAPVAAPSIIFTASTPVTPSLNTGAYLALTSLYMLNAQKHQTLIDALSIVGPPIRLNNFDHPGRQKSHTWSQGSLQKMWPRPLAP